jgi:hypothetical protein
VERFFFKVKRDCLNGQRCNQRRNKLENKSQKAYKTVNISIRNRPGTGNAPDEGSAGKRQMNAQLNFSRFFVQRIDRSFHLTSETSLFL